MKKRLSIILIPAIAAAVSCNQQQPSIPEQADTRSPQEIMFEDGNYAMFIHFGLYSKLESEWKGKTYYGIAEWIMNKSQAGISVEDYMAEAATFNPSEFDAEEVVRLAKDAGMKYIVITSKHHEGFAMFDSDACDFNIMDATPLKRDLMAELADACHRNGLGIGFYYSQFQDWTAPGGGGGPKTDANGKEVSFDEYFRTKCVPQVEELTTKYGEIELIWFDTPGNMSKEYSEELVRIVRKNQPHALVSSRVGNGVGDYESLGDMEVPLANIDGRWEGIDVMQVGWGFSRFDKQWKSPEYVLRTLVSTVARGGTFMMNVGPESSGRIPAMAAASLRKAGEWVRKYPQAIYAAGSSPWGHALPWGDVVTQGNKLYLVVFDWPEDGRLWLSGLENKIVNARVCGGKKLSFSRENNWVCIDVPYQKPDELAGVIELEVEGEIKVSGERSVNPNLKTVLPVELASIENCQIQKSAWMENFGEWKFKKNIYEFKPESTVSWTIDVQKAGVYNVALEYKADGFYEWEVSVDGEAIKNRRASSNTYEWHTIGWIEIREPGVHTLTVKAISGDMDKLNFSTISLDPIDL